MVQMIFQNRLLIFGDFAEVLKQLKELSEKHITLGDLFAHYALKVKKENT